ncbi:hypothetical protein BH09MYX1_BH09MYX1_44550 [soil metagenome]
MCSRWVIVLGFAVALLAACSGPVDALEGDDVGEDQLQTTKPIALHYGWLQSSPLHGTSDAKATTQPIATSAMIAKGIENVVVTAKPTDPAALAAWAPVAAEWKAHGGVLARHATPNEIVAASSGAGLASFVQAAIADGFAYVAVDELEPTRSARLHDGDPAAERFRDELHAMNEIPALRQRVILYASSFTMVDDLAGFSTVLRACRDYCRVFVNEVYLGGNDAFSGGTVTDNPKVGRRECKNGIGCIAYAANVVEAIAPGLGKRTITALGTGAPYLSGTTADDSYCGGSRGGSLRAEVAKVRSLGQPGVASYSDTAVASDANGGDFAVARDTYAACFRGLLQEGGFPSVTPTRAPDGFTLPTALPTLPVPIPPSACGRLDPGQGLGPGAAVTSCDGRFSLTMQDDGNLVLFQGATALWCTSTGGKNAYAAVMMGDGSFVLYGPSPAPIWSTQTSGATGAWLAIQDDGNLVGFAPNAIWTSGTSGH